MSGHDKGGYLDGGPIEVTADKPKPILTQDTWDQFREAVKLMLEFLHRDPKFRRIVRKQKARETKRQAIERRQVARAVRGIEWAPPLLRNGKAPR
jgi:hypothetical protein